MAPWHGRVLEAKARHLEGCHASQVHTARPPKALKRPVGTAPPRLAPYMLQALPPSMVRPSAFAALIKVDTRKDPGGSSYTEYKQLQAMGHH
jgi:hypothetical protein